ncbi:MAG: hypothetical protein GC146_13375 [Limimaricola sp.]|uniref:N-ATPase subunit AtpR n=1 Tax=Limimaricola sp. TaxID=2211665 RepID=UPI001D26608B|nr:ATP synthase subunit I [Limimaricola sp.]MBI1418205.1 hypothetical protein [Limimaricola sp.]
MSVLLTPLSGPSWALPVALALAFALGLVAGAVHFATLGWVARRLAEGQMRAVAVQVARMVVLAAVLLAMARWGWPMLLAAAVGLALGRALILRRERAAE